LHGYRQGVPSHQKEALLHIWSTWPQYWLELALQW
jgi:hypothetical protein